MGLYNIVKKRQFCQSCQNIAEFHVQFKFGEVYLHQYSIGDNLVWGKPQIGSSGYNQVVVDGIAENCPLCGAEGGSYEVWIENDKIVDVRYPSGMYQFSEETFIIIDDKKST